MNNVFTRFATAISRGAGRPLTFVVAVMLVAMWAVSGPLFSYSTTWQLVINTTTTIITFLMVFVLQNSQNRDSRAVQSKLDDLILTSRAHNAFIKAEDLDDDELEQLHAIIDKAKDQDK